MFEKQTEQLLGQQFQLDTYSNLTAEAIFAYANVHLTREALTMQLAAKDSFYTSLVRIPVRVVLNGILSTQCRTLQSYAQERLIEYILSGVESKMLSDPEVELKNKIEESRTLLIQLGSDLTDLEAGHYQLMLTVFVMQEKQAQQWSDEITHHRERLWKEIEQCKPDISPEWKEPLLEYLKTQAAAVIIPDKELKALKIKTDPSAAEKAVIQLFIDIGARVCPNVLDEAKNIEAEIRELQEALIAERDPAVVGVDQLMQVFFEKNKQFAEMRNIINDLLLKVDENVNAFKPSEDTINDNLNMNSLEELGFIELKNADSP